MLVHHLNCGTMRPRLTRETLVCHVLLIETGTSLTLVDAGIGLRDIADPTGFGSGRRLMRPDFDIAEAAISQIQALGHDPHDVRDIVLTHFDIDHTSGLSDFPWARVHLSSTERDAVTTPQGRREANRYSHARLDNKNTDNNTLVPHPLTDGDDWRGFSSATELDDIAPGIVLIGLPGHTRGHAAVAVDAGDHWVLHVGDAFYHRHQIDGGQAPFALAASERALASDWTQVKANHRTLAELWAYPESDLVMVNAHDPELLRRAQTPNS